VAILVGAGFFLATIGARADIMVESSGGVGNVTQPFGRHYVPAAPAGPFAIYALADDSKAGTSFLRTPGAYTPAAGSATAGPASVTGTDFVPSATAKLSWGFQPHHNVVGSWYWDSTGSGASVNPTGSITGETAKASAIVNDPASFHYQFQNELHPGVEFQTTFHAGLLVASQTAGPTMTTSASISGDFRTSLLPEPLWTYSWSSQSGSPGTSAFQFHPNPMLGLDASAIEAGFLSHVSTVNNVSTLLQDVTVDVVVPVTTDASGNVHFSSGGQVRYDDSGATPTTPTPEPSTLSLAAFGSLGLVVFGLKRRLRRSSSSATATRCNLL
jgi:hypothetical protein